MPSTKPYLRAAVLAALLSGAVQAESVVLHAEQATAGADTNTSAKVVDVQLTPESSKALAEFTRERVGKRIQLRSDGVLLSSAVLASPLEGNSFRITAGEHGFAGKSAEEIAQGIMKAGQLTIDDENTAK